MSPLARAEFDRNTAWPWRDLLLGATVAAFGIALFAVWLVLTAPRHG